MLILLHKEAEDMYNVNLLHICSKMLPMSISGILSKYNFNLINYANSISNHKL